MKLEKKKDARAERPGTFEGQAIVRPQVWGL